jgi:PAS domain S-box-containing protein
LTQPSKEDLERLWSIVGKRLDVTAHFLASIVESSDDAILTKDLASIIRSWNKSAEHLYGYTAEEALGKPVTILIPPERQNEEQVILERIQRGECMDHYEPVRQRKDVSLIEISLNSGRRQSHPNRAAHARPSEGDIEWSASGPRSGARAAVGSRMEGSTAD